MNKRMYTMYTAHTHTHKMNIPIHNKLNELMPHASFCLPATTFMWRGVHCIGGNELMNWFYRYVSVKLSALIDFEFKYSSTAIECHKIPYYYYNIFYVNFN